MIDMDALSWVTPQVLTPGDLALVYMLWTPYDDSYTLPGIPPPPQDTLLGFWSPSPRPTLEEDDDDPLKYNCAALVKGIFNLFQDSEEFAGFTIFGEEHLVPWDQERVVALLP